MSYSLTVYDTARITLLHFRKRLAMTADEAAALLLKLVPPNCTPDTEDDTPDPDEDEGAST